jgi:hypothetical protein
MVTFTPPSLYIRGNSQRALNGRLGGPQTQPWLFGIQKTSLLGMEPSFLSFKARLCQTGSIGAYINTYIHTFTHEIHRDIFWYCRVAVSRQSFTTQDWVQSQDSFYGICGEGENETSISPSLLCSTISHMFCTHIKHRYFEANAGVVF